MSWKTLAAGGVVLAILLARSRTTRSASGRGRGTPRPPATGAISGTSSSSSSSSTASPELHTAPLDTSSAPQEHDPHATTPAAPARPADDLDAIEAEINSLIAQHPRDINGRMTEIAGRLQALELKPPYSPDRMHRITELFTKASDERNWVHYDATKLPGYAAEVARQKAAAAAAKDTVVSPLGVIVPRSFLTPQKLAEEQTIKLSGEIANAPGHFVSASGKAYETPDQLAAAVVAGKDKLAINQDDVSQGARDRASFVAKLEKARKTGRYEALFAGQTPGFDPSLLKPGEFAYWRKVRSKIHDARTRSGILGALQYATYALSAVPIVGGLAWGISSALGAALESAGTTLSSAGGGAGGVIFGNPVVAPAFLKPLGEDATAQTAAEARQGVIDTAKAGVKVAASVAGAALGGLVETASSGLGQLGQAGAVAGEKTGLDLSRTGIDYGLDQIQPTAGTDQAALTSTAQAVAGGAQTFITRGF